MLYNITKKCGIYLLRNNLNNKIYIGKAHNVSYRISKHRNSEKNYYKGKSAIISAIKKYGWSNFSLEILEIFDQIPENLLEIEANYIKKYNATKRNIGYNFLERSTDWTGKTHTLETKNKISKILKIKMLGSKNPMFGKKHTEQSKSKMRKPKKRKSKKVKQINIETNDLIKIWNSATEASIFLTGKIVSKEQIYRACKNYKDTKGNIRKTALGFKWEYL